MYDLISKLYYITTAISKSSNYKKNQNIFSEKMC